MSGVRYQEPIRLILGERIFPGGTLTVLVGGESSQLASIYADAACTVALSNPLTANAAGGLPPVYAPSSDEGYDLVGRDAEGLLVISSSTNGIAQPLSLSDADPRDENGRTLPFATRAFFAAETLVPQAIYSDSSLGTEIDNPQTASELGVFEAAWLDAHRAYRVILRDRAGRLLHDVGNQGFIFTRLPPEAPVLSGELTDVTTASLSWNEPASDNPIAGYRLYDAADDSLIVDQPGRTFIAEGLNEDSSYSYYVVAYTDLAVSPHSNTVTLDTGHPDTIIEIFTANSTWTKRVNLVSADVIVVGGGAGGRSGGISPSSDSGNGAGGGAGGLSQGSFLAADLGATESITVGAGGTGGIGPIGAGSAAATNGTNGGASSFGAHLSANGGICQNFNGGGTGGTGSTQDGATGGYGGRSNDPDKTAQTGSSATLAPGGGGGGGATDEGAASTGGAAGGTGDSGDGGAAGGTPGGTGVPNGVNGGDGVNATGNTYCGGGGAGGGAGSATGSDTFATGGKGGNGGLYGGGAGGGGAAGAGDATGAVTLTGGNGGNGAKGVVVVINHLS